MNHMQGGRKGIYDFLGREVSTDETEPGSTIVDFGEVTADSTSDWPGKRVDVLNFSKDY